MKTLSIILLLVGLISCQSTSTNQKAEMTTQPDSAKSDSALKINSFSPLLAEIREKSDSMILKLNNQQLLISSSGKVFSKNKLLFDIKSKLPMKKLFVQPSGDDFIVFYMYSDPEGAGSYAKRISIKQSKIVWETPIYAFNLSNPLIVGDYAYLSTMGFVGKLNLSNGKYVWKFEDINKKYEIFNQPKFFKDSLVLFTHGTYPIADSVLIDDRNGKIVKMN
jgi:hypothetical protein